MEQIAELPVELTTEIMTLKQTVRFQSSGISTGSRQIHNNMLV